MVASEATIEELSTVLELESDTEPPPAEKSSIKPGYWKAELAQITKLELDCAAMEVVLSDFCKQRLSVQQDFNLMDEKLNDPKTYSKDSRVEML